MENVKKWLKSETPDYTAGVALFAKHSKNASLLHFLQRKGDKAMSKLRYELEKIIGIDPFKKTGTKVDEVQPPKEERVKINADGTIKRKDLPEQLQTLYDLNAEDYKLMRGAHAAMAASKSQKERAEFRAQVDKLDDAIAARWAIIDSWVATGEVPEIEATPKSDNKLDAKTVGAYRTYLSRAIVDGDRLTDQRKATAQQRISALLADGHALDEETIAKLKDLGFNVE